MAAFDRSVQEPLLHHRKSWQTLAPGTELRIQLDLFLEGYELRFMPALAEVVMELFFMSVVERRGERDHSVVHKGHTGRRPGGPNVSLTLRMPEIETLALEDSACGIVSLSQKFDQVRDPLNAARLFRVSRHPLLQEARTQKLSQHEVRSRLADVIYSLDPHSQFQVRTDTRKRHAQARKDKQKKLEQIRQAFGLPMRLCAESVEGHAMVEHCRLRMQPGQLFSMPTGSTSFWS